MSRSVPRPLGYLIGSGTFSIAAMSSAAAKCRNVRKYRSGGTPL